MSIKSQSPYRISVLLVTYNHEPYIRQALDALFGQKLDEAIELVIADDASSDDTLATIKSYEGKDTRFIFKYLDNIENLGITKNYQRGFSHCAGEYVAVLEGDDYWTSPFKLQRQADFLDRHWECNLCSVNYFVFDESRSHLYVRTEVEPREYRLVNARDLIADNLVGNFSTCMYRKSALNALPSQLFEICSYDWIVNICITSSSWIGFLEEPMSVYRLHANGTWGQTSHLKKLNTQLELIPAYDDLTNYFFHEEFEVLSTHLQRMIQINQVSQALEEGGETAQGVSGESKQKTLDDVMPVNEMILPVEKDIAQPLCVESAQLPSEKAAINVPSQIDDYLPPLLLDLTRALIPPKLKRFVVRVLQRGAA